RTAARAALPVAPRDSGLAAGDGLPLPRPLLRGAQARPRGRSRELGHSRARARQGVRPRGRRQERPLPAGRDLQRARTRRCGRGALRGALDVLPELPGFEELSPPDQPDGHDQSEGVMKSGRLIQRWVLAAAIAALPALAFALEEQSLLTPDGTVHIVRTGSDVDLGVSSVSHDDYFIEVTSLGLDGTDTDG